jgi:RNA recognition motif-containing protein
MDVIFKNIPIGMRDYELTEFIKSNFITTSIDKKRLPLSVDGVSMLEIQDNFTHPIKQFCIIRITSSKIAQQVIKQLNGCFIKQYQLIVREYHSRSTKNDTRHNSPISNNNFTEKRKSDRRQSTLIYSRRV